jgi:hypothetical protein
LCGGHLDVADELEHIDLKIVVLVKALGIDSRCFDYVYDFGDDWHHIVIVEEQIPDRDVATVSGPLQRWSEPLLWGTS